MASFKTAGPNLRLSMLLSAMGMSHDRHLILTPGTASTTLRSTCKPCREAFTSTPGYDPGEDEETDMSHDEHEKMMEAQAHERVRERMRNDAPGRLTGSHNTPDRPRPEVPRELEQLQVRISAMINLAAELRERVAPVLSSGVLTPPQAEKELASPDVYSDMGLTLRSRIEEVEEAIRIVRDIHERLEL